MTPLRALALDPTTKGFAYAVLEGSTELLDWGLAQPRVNGDSQSLRRIKVLLSRYEPELVVLEDGENSRRGARAKRFLAKAEALAREHGIEVRRISRTRVREVFKPSDTTKHGIALEVSRLFPHLASRLPRKRKPWMSEDERMSIFDAVSFGLAVLSAIERTEAA